MSDILTILLPLPDNLMEGQSDTERYDLVSQVFKLKVNKLLNLIKKGVFGADRIHICTIEWQNRGLPHCYLLVWFKKNIDPNQIDAIINADLPIRTEDEVLFEIIRKHKSWSIRLSQSSCMIEMK